MGSLPTNWDHRDHCEKRTTLNYYEINLNSNPGASAALGSATKKTCVQLSGVCYCNAEIVIHI